MSGELLEEERHALRRLEDRRCDLLVQCLALRKRVDETARVVTVMESSTVAPSLQAGAPL